MRYNKIISILIVIFISTNITIVFGQGITFKKVYPAFNFTGNGNNVICKPYNNDKSFLISVFGNGLKLLKIDSTGNLKSNKNFYNFLSYCNLFFKNDKSFILSLGIYQDRHFLILDTSFNILSFKKYDSINLGYMRFDKCIIKSTLDTGFIASGCKNRLYPVIIKIDKNDNLIWSKYYSSINGEIRDIIQTNDSGFAIAMNLKNLGASLVKTDKVGTVLWAKSYFRPHGYIHNVIENTDGTMIIIGNIDSSLTSSPLFFVKLNQTGNVIWAKTFGNSINNIVNLPSYTKQTRDGGYITLATVTKNLDDLLLIKTDSFGDTLWVREHGSPNSIDYGQSVEQLNDKGYIVSGNTNTNIPAIGSSLYIIRTDSLGHTSSRCEEYGLPLAVNTITVNDSNINATAVPLTVTTGVANTSTSSFTTNAYDGCKLDDIKEIMAEQTAPILIYPSPTDGLFSIETKMSIPVKTLIEIYNINGEKVYASNLIENITSINLTGYAKGLYFIKLSNERWIKTGKVMVY